MPRKTRRSGLIRTGWIGRAALPGLLLLTLAAQAQAQPLPAEALPPHPTPDGLLRAALSLPAPPGGLLRTAVETAPPRLALKGPPPDPWLGFDKAQHVAFSFLWVLGSQYTLVNKLDVREPQAWPVSLGTGAALGLAKELYDGHLGRHRYFSYRDLVADALGLLLAAGLIAL